MEYISSDTNVWFDFYSIEFLEIPFRLDCTYIMYYEALRSEIIDPPELIKELQSLGLFEIEIEEKEFYYAEEIMDKYSKLSGYDAIALSVAKCRNIKLLTGDGALRRAAKNEDVECMGSIGLIDRLYDESKMSKEEYLDCLERWKLQVKEGRRLPIDEIDNRINTVVQKEGEKLRNKEE